MGNHRTLFNYFKVYCMASAGQCWLKDRCHLANVYWVHWPVILPSLHLVYGSTSNQVTLQVWSFMQPRPHNNLNASHLHPLYMESYPLLRSLLFCKILSLFIFLSVLEQTRLSVGLFFSSKRASSMSSVMVIAEDAVIDPILNSIPKPQLALKRWKLETHKPSRMSFCAVLSEVSPYQYWLFPQQDMHSSPVTHTSAVGE